MNALINNSTAATKTKHQEAGSMEIRQAMIDGLDKMLAQYEAHSNGTLEAVATEELLKELRKRLNKAMMRDPRVRGVRGMSV